MCANAIPPSQEKLYLALLVHTDCGLLDMLICSADHREVSKDSLTDSGTEYTVALTT